VKTLTCVALAASFLSPLAMADDCRYSRDINFDVAVQGLERLTIDVGAGELNVTGPSQSDMISVRAVACADSQNKLDDLDLTQDSRGDRLEITSETGDSDWGSVNWFGSTYAYIDVNIAIPAGLVIDIDDGSGDITLRDVSGNFSIEDGSGGIEITRVTGDVQINDGSGDVRVEEVTGSVRLEDGSGDLELSSISADVHVLGDGSGDIRIATVGGNVTVDDDGSGDIRVRDVMGSFETGDTGSGDVDYSGVEGRVAVR
jgi:hypothetical protein